MPRRELEYTFANPLSRADLLAIFHCVQGKIYLGYGLLVLHSAGGDLEIILGCVHLFELSHGGREGGEYLDGVDLGKAVTVGVTAKGI